MKILHYALGFPPYRTGGLTKFCIDLMVQQSKEGHVVGMFWPGKMGFLNNKTRIKKHKSVLIKEQELLNFEIINPLPVSFDEGIVDIKAFTKNVETEAYRDLLNFYKPDVIHIHTLMGLHKNLLEVAKKKGIRIVFTAHDFFPLCPKVTLYRHNTVCESAKNCEECSLCNSTALSLWKIKILQSPFYRRLKDSFIVKQLRKNHRNNYLNDLCETSENHSKISKDGSIRYKELRSFYFEILSLMDVIHYNSTVTKKAYESIFYFKNNCVIPITHADIKDNKKIKEFKKDVIRIRYLGPQANGKGFFVLKKALDDLWKKQTNFCLDVHFQPLEMSPYINIHERYSYEELENIFNETDLLVVPSVWYETFGFTVIEALSFGVPVILSDNVGAKDILVDGAGIVIENISSEKIVTVLQSLTLDRIKKMNRTIVNNQSITLIDVATSQIEEKCYGWIKGAYYERY